ncbi:DNA cytosine methyltransferase [Anaerococcus sp. NML200574]|uniref:DNA cytosine methyltransferase n=1 Tax=Anaerococcus sp. NML200574 TaxID=2954486 RepID=UPI002237BD49|nr:DNA cytosine methyltransferase [Anaerococcus sp. NML200574]MCW6678168.1 DNA cytosine methyltransferase [Anaerococcus sp. NML200574]
MLRVFESFAGIGTQRMGLERAGIDHEVVGICEIDKFAIDSYEAIHGQVNNYGDISKIDPKDLPDFDLFTYSFPCQDISMAGKQKGFDKESGTRSSLLWECERIIEEKRPKYLLMENVKALTFKKNEGGYQKWLDTLTSLGYANYSKVLDAKDYGVPQNRERVFCISILDDKQGFEFPEKQVLETRLKDVLEHNVDEKYYLSNDRVKQLVGIVRNWGVKGKTVFDSSTVETELIQTYKLNNDKRDNPERYRVFDKEGLSPTLNTCQGGGRQPCISIDLPAIAASRGRKKDEKYVQQLEFNKNGITNTLTTVEKDNYLVTSDTNKTIPIKNGTKKGYLEAHQGDGIDLINPTCNNRRGRVQKDCSQTLTCNNDRGVVTDDFRIRKLTPLEFWRLMGIEDKDFYKARKVNSDSQLYKQAGNAIVVDVLAAIFMQLFNKN